MTPEEAGAFERLALKAQELAKSGKPAEAEELVRQVPTAERLEGYFHEKVLAFIEIASAFAGERSPKTENLLREVEALARNLRCDGIWHEGDALACIGDVWVMLGNRDEALRLFRGAAAAIEAAPFHDDGSYSVLARLARRLRDAGEADEAEALIRKLPPAMAKSRGWS